MTTPTEYCPRCALPVRIQHLTTMDCLAEHQAALKVYSQEYEKLKANAEKAQRGMKDALKLLWKLAAGRGTIAFSDAEIKAIPPGANVTVTRKLDEGLTITAIVKESVKPEDILGKETARG